MPGSVGSFGFVCLSVNMMQRQHSKNTYISIINHIIVARLNRFNLSNSKMNTTPFAISIALHYCNQYYESFQLYKKYMVLWILMLLLIIEGAFERYHVVNVLMWSQMSLENIWHHRPMLQQPSNKQAKAIHFLVHPTPVVAKGRYPQKPVYGQ